MRWWRRRIHGGIHGAAAGDGQARPVSDRGYSLVEAAITLPAMVLLCMIVIQYALLWHGRHVAEAAAREGVEAARGYQATAGAGQAAARSYLTQVAPNLVVGPSIGVSRSATTVRVTIRATVLRVIPAGRFTIDESASGPVERFVANGPPVPDGVPGSPPGILGTAGREAGAWL